MPERFQVGEGRLFCAPHQKAGLEQLGTKAGVLVLGKSLVFASDRLMSKSGLHCFTQSSWLRICFEAGTFLCRGNRVDTRQRRAFLSGEAKKKNNSCSDTEKVTR